jgi:hypothetical protein
MASDGSGPSRHNLSLNTTRLDGSSSGPNSSTATNKRSYREYDGGVADDSERTGASGPSDAGSSGTGSDRNKRPRSEPGDPGPHEPDDLILSEPGSSSSSTSALTLARPSSSSNHERRGDHAGPSSSGSTHTLNAHAGAPADVLLAPLPSPLAPVLPPHSPHFLPFHMRPPTPDYTLLGLAHLSSPERDTAMQVDRPLPETLRRSIDRFTAFDNELSALRRSPPRQTPAAGPSRLRSRSPTPPPMLPPLAFEDPLIPGLGPSSAVTFLPSSIPRSSEIHAGPAISTGSRPTSRPASGTGRPISAQITNPTRDRHRDRFPPPSYLDLADVDFYRKAFLCSTSNMSTDRSR